MDQRGRDENHAVHRVPFNASGRLPCLLKKFVRFPVPLFIEEIHAFPQNLTLPHQARNLVKKLDSRSLGNLLLKQLQLLLQHCLILREEIELDSTRTDPQVSNGLT